MEQSWRAGRLVETERAETIADGIAVRVPVAEALDYLRDAVDEVVLVSEDALWRATQLVWGTLGIIVETAGAAGVAALLEYPAMLARGLVATPLCGGNLTSDQLAALMSEDAVYNTPT